MEASRDCPDAAPPPRARLQAAWLLPALLPAILALAWLGGFVWFVANLPATPAAPGARTDAIVVLTGGSQRLSSGVALLRQGLAETLFVSGVDRGVGVAQLMRRAKAMPEPSTCCVVLGYDAHDTLGNARETASFMAARHYHSLRLVTANYHMRRALIEFRRAMPAIAIYPNPVVPEAMREPRWWSKPATLAILAGEYDKLIAAWTLDRLSFGLPWHPFGPSP